MTVPHGPPDVREVKIWAHRLTAAGDSLGLHADADLDTSEGRTRTQVTLARGEAVLPVTGAAAHVRVRFPPAVNPEVDASGAGSAPPARPDQSDHAVLM